MPLDPDNPDEPLVPDDPDDPDSPDTPLVPDEPLVPLDPDVPSPPAAPSKLTFHWLYTPLPLVVISVIVKTPPEYELTDPFIQFVALFATITFWAIVYERLFGMFMVNVVVSGSMAIVSVDVVLYLSPAAPVAPVAPESV